MNKYYIENKYLRREKILKDELRKRMMPFKVGFVANVTLLIFSLIIFIIDGYANVITSFLPTGIVVINFIIVIWNACIELIIWDD
ncbi:MAG: hypothetical protein LBJ61_02460 [Deltaproteobacteria bacterium]|jgi:uncharacterized membrane protein|nr:hypothetical protein [Deltaproteobacteria bacterium]